MDVPLDYREAGSGPCVLLVHGGAEDAGLLTPQAEALAARGRRVIWYDRRGTGGSTRDGWPDGGVAQHADDAALLLRALDGAPATVFGFSSGGVIALEVAVRHPELVDEVIAWEPAAVGVLPGGADLHAEILAPIEAHLVEHPGDWTGAYGVMLAVLSEGRADLGSPLVERQLANAEAVLRDDARVITPHQLPIDQLPADIVTIAVGAGTSPLHAAVAGRLADALGRPAEVVTAATDHEVYLSEPEVLADWLVRRHRSASALQR